MIRNILIGFSLLALVSCSNDNDDKLLGKWQLQKRECNGVIETVDTVFYNFQHSLFMYQILNKAGDPLIYQYGFNSAQKNDSLYIELANDPRDVNKFLPYTDWSTATRGFKIDQLSNSKLVLSADSFTYVFRKF